MFEGLKRHSRIIVTGPQRSGTRIGAQMIAHDTEHRYVDEVEFGVNQPDPFFKVLEQENIVVHCPGMMQWPGTNLKRVIEVPIFTVVMRRCIEDIQASMQRINWGSWHAEAMHYGLRQVAHDAWIRDAIPAIKYAYFDSKQAPEIEPEMLLNLQYDNLSRHPMWVDKSQRTNFKWNQTAVSDG